MNGKKEFILNILDDFMQFSMKKIQENPNISPLVMMDEFAELAASRLFIAVKAREDIVSDKVN